MNWIILSLIYAVTNAIYTEFNSRHNYNAYVLGIWRGFGISLVISPLLFTVPLDIPADYFLILVLQGVMIGIYDSRLFFASGRWGSHTGSGFMATTVWITILLWWSIDIAELKRLLHTPEKLITLAFIVCGFSVSYWQMMKVHVSPAAEKYLYPAVFALALMSIATRYIALNGGSAYAGVVYYLTIACFTSGIYNTIMYLTHRPQKQNRKQSKIPARQGIWLVAFSTILIGAKTLALRFADNPGYVVAMLLLSPMIADVIRTERFRPSPSAELVIIFLILLIILVY